MNIANLLLRSAAIYNTEPAIALAEYVTLTFHEIAKRSTTTACKLQLKDLLTSKEVVVIIVRNPPKHIEFKYPKNNNKKTLNSQLSQLYG